jgi:hypothetical protein
MSVFPYKHPTLNGVYMRCYWAHVFGQCCILPSKYVYVGMMEKYCFSSQYRPHMETRGTPKPCYHGLLIVPRHDPWLQGRVCTSFQKFSRCDIFHWIFGIFTGSFKPLRTYAFLRTFAYMALGPVSQITGFQDGFIRRPRWCCNKRFFSCGTDSPLTIG